MKFQIFTIALLVLVSCNSPIKVEKDYSDAIKKKMKKKRHMQEAIIFLILSVVLLLISMPKAKATLQNETLYCFQGFNANGNWIEWVNGTNATPKGNAGNTYDGCPLSFPSCAVYDGTGDYFNISPSIVTNLTQGGITVVMQGNDTQGYGSILTVSRPFSGQANLMTIVHDTTVGRQRLLWDVQDNDLTRQSWASPPDSLVVNKDYQLMFQSDGGYGTNYTWFINGSNQTFAEDIAGTGEQDGTFYNMSKYVPSNSYDTAVSGVAIGNNWAITYDFKGKMSMLLILNKSIKAEKYNETFTPLVQNCTQILGI